MLKRVLALIMVLTFTTTGVAAGKPLSLFFSDYERAISPIVKQQSPGSHDGEIPTDPSTWVRNPTTCIWDADDRFTSIINNSLNGTQSDGYLDAGKTVIQNECVISDTHYITHLLAIQIYAPSPNLIVSLTLGETVLTAPAIKNGKEWIYKLCTVAPVPGNSGPIEGSTSQDGTRIGIGQYFPLIYSISNPTQQRIRSIGGVFVADLNRTGNQEFYCI